MSTAIGFFALKSYTVQQSADVNNAKYVVFINRICLKMTKCRIIAFDD